jgi:hypothetical protein
MYDVLFQMEGNGLFESSEWSEHPANRARDMVDSTPHVRWERAARTTLMPRNGQTTMRIMAFTTGVNVDLGGAAVPIAREVASGIRAIDQILQNVVNRHDHAE